MAVAGSSCVPPAAASTSALTIRPPGPVPSSASSSSPISRAIRRATGLARMRPFSAAAPRPRPAPPRRGCSGSGSGSGSASSEAGSGCGLLLSAPFLVLLLGRGLLVLLLGLGLRLLLLRGGLLRLAAACGSSAAASPMLAIFSPTASVSPSEAEMLRTPSWSAS